MKNKYDTVLSISKPLFEFPVDSFLCGVYFLMHNDECVYIGHSNNVYKRIGDHQIDSRKAGKFNNIRFLETDCKYRDIVEGYLIGFFCPQLNNANGYPVKGFKSLSEIISYIDKYLM